MIHWIHCNLIIFEEGKDPFWASGLPVFCHQTRLKIAEAQSCLITLSERYRAHPICQNAFHTYVTVPRPCKLAEKKRIWIKDLHKINWWKNAWWKTIGWLSLSYGARNMCLTCIVSISNILRNFLLHCFEKKIWLTLLHLSGFVVQNCQESKN